MSEAQSTDLESLPAIFSPQRFFLDAPRQTLGTCFVLNTDFQQAMAEVGRLRSEIERLERELRLAVSARDYANDMLDRERTKRLQAEHERDCAVETLAAARIFLLDNGPMKLIAPMIDRLDKALGFAPIGADDVEAEHGA